MTTCPWTKPVDDLEIKFRMECCKWIEEPCDYHRKLGEYDDGCYDCGRQEWRSMPFDRNLLPFIDENGYINNSEQSILSKFRVCSNSIKQSDVPIRDQINALMKKNKQGP